MSSRSPAADSVFCSSFGDSEVAITALIPPLPRGKHLRVTLVGLDFSYLDLLLNEPADEGRLLI